MGEWIAFNNCGQFRLIESKNRYTIVQMVGDDEQVVASHREPFTPYLKQGTKFYDALYTFAENNWSAKDFKNFQELFVEFAQELLANRITQDEIDRIEDAKKKASEENSQKFYDKYYESLYSEFRMYMEKYDKSALELVVSCSRCLVADSVREVVRAFVGYFQTLNGIKATNVIAIGSPASGKSFILETALSMMPQEFIHYGVMTESAFFETFDGQNLDGHIFMLGDLGGAKDDEKTIIFRDLLKALSTDGEVSRTISKGDSKERTPTKQVVKGHPALTYSTAHEEIVNEQEKSRSVILTPQPINPKALSIFDFVMENNGKFRNDIEEINRVRNSIQGLVYCFNYMEEDGFVNPYEYDIVDVLEEKDDYNRKIQEYKATLKVVTLLDNPYYIYHNYYTDDLNNSSKSKLVFATKRNNLNAMNLFDAVNFLPDEARFGDKLLDSFEVFDLDELDDHMQDYYEESDSFEDKVKALVTSIDDYTTDDEGAIWVRRAFYNEHNDYFSPTYPKFQKNVFTVSTLKKKFRGKWFNQHKHYLPERLRKLWDEDVLIKLGKSPSKENVYALNNNNGSKISEKLPSFDDESKVADFKAHAFDLVFPNCTDGWDEFIEMDSEKPEEKSLTESVDALIPTLPFLKEVSEDV